MADVSTFYHFGRIEVPMKYSGIGGQAVMEGVMMRNREKYAVAVRRSDHEIEVKVSELSGAKEGPALRKLPVIRGVVSFVESLYLGMSTLMFSASFFEEEDEEEKNRRKGLSAGEKERLEAKEKKQERALMSGTVALSIVMALALFFALPYALSAFFRRFIASELLLALIEGVIRLAVFIAYIALIALTPDIRRTFMYHGAEHKCINCIENGRELNVENVRESSRFHRRCGTSFLLIVMVISILFFMFIRVDSGILRLLLRLLLIPLIAGVSYEFIRLAGRSDNRIVSLFSMPGLLLQRLTTREPDDEMIEVAIASVEAVFDWRSWQSPPGDGSCRS